MEEDKRASRLSENERGVGASPAVDEEVLEKGGKVRIQNVGGSLTFLFQIALLAWGVRQLRSVLARRKDSLNRASHASGSTSPAYARISATALRLLLRLKPMRYTLLDVRFREAVKASPPPLEGTINIPERELRSSLQLPGAAWEHRFGASSVAQPGKRQMLVVLSTRGRRAERAAAVAASLGYSRCCVLVGGLQSLSQAQQPAPEPNLISRDAAAVLLERASLPASAAPAASFSAVPNGDSAEQHANGEAAVASSRRRLPLIIDMRRHDERTLYGSISASVHLPVDELPLALAMDAPAWELRHGFPKPAPSRLVIVYCRSENRSRWAAQVAADAGFSRWHVLRGGVCGWRLEPSVMPYDGYAQGQAPSNPIPFDVEPVDRVSGEHELAQILQPYS